MKKLNVKKTLENGLATRLVGTIAATVGTNLPITTPALALEGLGVAGMFVGDAMIGIGAATGIYRKLNEKFGKKKKEEVAVTMTEEDEKEYCKRADELCERVENLHNDNRPNEEKLDDAFDTLFDTLQLGIDFETHGMTEKELKNKRLKLKAIKMLKKLLTTILAVIIFTRKIKTIAIAVPVIFAIRVLVGFIAKKLFKRFLNKKFDLGL